MIPTNASRLLRSAVPVLALCAAVALQAHDTWLSPAPSTARVGGTVTVLLASGHAFPEAEEPVRNVTLKVIVVDPSGKSTVLATSDQGRGPEASFQVDAQGVYRVAGEYDRGLISRTPAGWKPGGKSEHPNATGSIKSYNSFLCAVRTSGTALASSAPLGLAFEVSWERRGDRLIARATAKNRPVQDAEISLILGAGEAKPWGKTGADGRLEVAVPGAFKGLLLLKASSSKPMPPGSEWDEERASSSHYLTWE